MPQNLHMLNIFCTFAVAFGWKGIDTESAQTILT